MKNHLLILIFLVFSFISCEREDIIYPENVFVNVEHPIAIARACGTAFTVNDKAYITLGRNRGLLNDCWEFNPANASWSKKQDFPGAGRVFPISAVVDGKAFVGMGYSNGGVYKESSYLRDFWMYDPVTDLWTQRADFPSLSTNHAVSFVFEGEIYIMHGFRPNGFSFDCWKYSPDTDSWKQLSDFPGDFRSSAIACSDGIRYFAGTGYDTSNKNDWWEYFPAKDTWKKRKSMPDAGRINALSFSADNRFFVATGRYFAGEHTGGHLKSDLLEYSATENHWTKVGDIPGGGRENAVSFILLNKVYIGFGENENEVMNDLWHFEP